MIKNKLKLIPDSVAETETFMKEKAGLGTNSDLVLRKLEILEKDVHLYGMDGLTETSYVMEIIERLLRLNDTERNPENIFDLIENNLVHRAISRIETLDELVDKVFSGSVVVLVDGIPKGLVANFRTYPGRFPEEPETEKTIRGPRDGYVENMVINTALTRRRIRDHRLRFELVTVGERSKTDIAIGYIKGLADPDLIDIIRKELKNIKIDGLPMADKTVEEFTVKQGYNPYPLVRYTERPDIASAHLLEGHVIIIVDTSPSVIMTPTTFFHHMQHAEEFRQSPAVGTMFRWVRFLGILASIFLVPVWLLFCLEPSLLPESLAFIGPNKETNIPIVTQLLIIEAGMEFLRLAAIHTPTPLSTAMGLIAAVLIGEMAINVGLFVPEVILYSAIANVGTFVTPSVELGSANKISRLVLFLAVAIFHLPGFIIGVTLFIIMIANIKTFSTPYLWPFIPFRPKALLQIIISRPFPGSRIRPSITHPQDRYRQPK